MDFEAFETIKDISTGDRREIKLDFTPELYARYKKVIPRLIWKCKGCGSFVYDRDQHESWHSLITRMVSFLVKK